jgi:hypothetical protein
MPNSLLLVLIVTVVLVISSIIYCLIRNQLKQVSYRIHLKGKKRSLIKEIKRLADELQEMSFHHSDVKTAFYTIRNNLLDDLKPCEQSGRQMSKLIFKISKMPSLSYFKPDELKHIQKRFLDLNFIIDEIIQLEGKLQ